MIQKLRWLATVLVFAALQSCNTKSSEPVAVDGVRDSSELDRTVLPINAPARQTYKELDARNAKAPARWEVKAPKGAPNVVVVLIDDMGFGASSAFGGPVNMPTLEKVAATGLK